MIQALTRTITHDLDHWYSSPNRKPLLLRGARQTGKTWIVNAFGASHFDHVARIDFMRDVDARALFGGNLTTATLLRSIEIYTGVPVRAESTLIFLDEIQECPRAITALKYFCEDAPDYHVVAAGSYMGISRHEDVSFPVGKVDMLTLHPLTFAEFLTNAGQSALAELICEGDISSIPTAFSPRLTELLKTYMMVGGMPEVVLVHLNGASVQETRANQLAILDSYDLDFSKHAPTRLLERIRLVWRSLPAQLAKENRRFVYGVVRPGARARDFEESLMWLEDYGIITRVPCVSALRAPLSSYADPAVFKLFVSDIGLLGALADLDPAVVLNGSAIFTEFKGAFTEQLVCQQLVAQQYSPYYWANPQGHAEVDFAVEQYGTIYPIEVKAAVNLRAKSLHVACDRFHLDHAFRMAMTDYRDEGWITNFPLWAAIGLHAYLERTD